MTSGAELHPAEGDLMGYLDGAIQQPERGAIAQHLTQCAECTARLDGLRRRAEDLARMLRRTDPAPRRRSTRTKQSRFWPVPRGLRVAGLIAVVAGAAFGVRPVRAWITDRSRQIWFLIAGRGTPSVGMVETRADEAAGSVSFEPTTSTLQIEIASRQAEGSLVIEGSNNVMTSLDIT